jgi:hypothetical protein
MRSRREQKSLTARIRGTAPAFAVIGLGIVAVFVAMNVLVTSAPIILSSTPTPRVSTTPEFPVVPSFVPSASAAATDTPGTTASLPPFGPTIIHSQVSENDGHGIWSVYLSYPAFLEGTTPWAKEMNDEILIEVQTRADRWAQGPTSNPRSDGKLSTLDGSFTIDLLTPELASFTMTWTDDSFPLSKAYGVETLNYDLSTGMRIPMDQVFADSSTALVFMSVSVLPQLVDELGPDYEASVAVGGTSPSPDHYAYWALSPKGVKVTFSQNQVTLRAGPPPFVVVPWSAVISVMVQTGPIAQLAGIGS